MAVARAERVAATRISSFCSEARPVSISRWSNPHRHPARLRLVELGWSDGTVVEQQLLQTAAAGPDSPLADNLIGLAAQEVGCQRRRGQVRAVGPDSAIITVHQRSTTTKNYGLVSGIALVNPGRDPTTRETISYAGGYLYRRQRATLRCNASPMKLREVTDVIIVDRLREIRVLRGFHRHTMNKTVEPSLGKKVNFLPAIEVFGEGVFLRINENASRSGRSQQVSQRARSLASASRGASSKSGSRRRGIRAHDHDPHTGPSADAADVLRRGLLGVFPPGADLRGQRPESPLAGLLIYTAAGDSEGSLGGLARLGEPERLVPVLARALGAAQWCSLDPVCRESTGQGTDALSLAACHACALAAETSCTHSAMCYSTVPLSSTQKSASSVKKSRSCSPFSRSP